MLKAGEPRTVKDDMELLGEATIYLEAEIERLRHECADLRAEASLLGVENNELRHHKAFLIRLIRGEGNPDMIEQMEHFLGLRDA
jgi:hypothetical protein